MESNTNGNTNDIIESLKKNSTDTNHIKYTSRSNSMWIQTQNPYIVSNDNSSNLPSDNLSSDNFSSDNLHSDNIHSYNLPSDNTSLSNHDSFFCNLYHIFNCFSYCSCQHCSCPDFSCPHCNCPDFNCPEFGSC